MTRPQSWSFIPPCFSGIGIMHLLGVCTVRVASRWSPGCRDGSGLSEFWCSVSSETHDVGESRSRKLTICDVLFEKRCNRTAMEASPVVEVCCEANGKLVRQAHPVWSEHGCGFTVGPGFGVHTEFRFEMVLRRGPDLDELGLLASMRKS